MTPPPSVSPAPSPQRSDSLLGDVLAFCKVAGAELARFGRWCAANPASAALLAAILATVGIFYGGVHIFVNGAMTAARWSWEAWNPDMNQEHSRLVLPIFLGLILYHFREIERAPKAGSNRGLWWAGFGVLLFVLAARCLQPRMAIMSVPFLIYGSVLYLWGKNVARIILFPCAFLIFMVPASAIEQATFKLQFVITGIVGFLANIVGIQIQAIGTTLNAGDGSFNFEVAEGCSGIRSLLTMAMLVSLFVHVTQRQLWKKVVIFSCSLLFAILGNAARIFTVLLVAKFYDAGVAGGIYHHYSGFVFFPVAFLAMMGFTKLVNADLGHLTTPDLAPAGASDVIAREAAPADASQPHAKPETSYDY